MHEFEFIDWLKGLLDNPADRGSVPVGIGDDMAVIQVGPTPLLMGSDMTIEGVHFDFKTARPEQVGHKALGRCLSDLAAMAGVPLGAIISVARPKEMDDEALKGVFRGIDRLARRFGCPIIGGDTSSSPGGLVLDVSLLGKCEQNVPALRSGAKPGNYLYVTGPLGGAISGKHLGFEPRIEQALWLARNMPLRAMIDLSDGLSSDLHHLCRESGCGGELFEANLETMIAPAARNLARQSGRPALSHALGDGEDFELLAAIDLAPEKLPALPAGVNLAVVGRIIEGTTVSLVHADATREVLKPRGFRHF